MYAIVETGGKQYKVSPGDVVRVERLAGEPGQELTMDKVLVLNDGTSLHVGRPYVSGAQVVARIVEQGRGKKIRVFKKKRRKGYHKTQGHRQEFTGLKIMEIRLQ